jgi:hypothetical protein
MSLPERQRKVNKKKSTVTRKRIQTLLVTAAAPDARSVVCRLRTERDAGCLSRLVGARGGCRSGRGDRAGRRARGRALRASRGLRQSAHQEKSEQHLEKEPLFFEGKWQTCHFGFHLAEARARARRRYSSLAHAQLWFQPVRGATMFSSLSRSKNRGCRVR